MRNVVAELEVQHTEPQNQACSGSGHIRCSFYNTHKRQEHAEGVGAGANSECKARNENWAFVTLSMQPQGLTSPAPERAGTPKMSLKCVLRH